MDDETRALLQNLDKQQRELTIQIAEIRVWLRAHGRLLTQLYVSTQPHLPVTHVESSIRSLLENDEELQRVRLEQRGGSAALQPFDPKKLS